MRYVKEAMNPACNTKANASLAWRILVGAGNMLAKQPIYFDEARATGLVCDAGVPILLTSCADPAKVRTASAALLALMAARNRKTMDIP